MKLSLSYLKPNFSNHPLNWISVLVVFFTSFISTYALSDETYQPGFYFQVLNFSPSNTPLGAVTPALNAYIANVPYFQSATLTNTPDCSFSSCRFDYTVYYLQDGTSLRTLFPKFIVYKHSCTDNAVLYCQPPEFPNNCPESGTFAGYISAALAVGSNASLNGCSVLPNYVDVECKSDAYETFPDGSMCRQIKGYQYTGDLSQSGDFEINPSDVTETDPLEPTGVRPSTSNTDIFQDSETLPDGTQVHTKTTTTTENRGSGHVAEETTTTKTHKFSNGITYTEVTIETTVTAPDGSKTVTTETNTTYTANPVTTVNITKPLGPVHQSSSNPVSSSTTVTKTETFDSDGNKTGSSTSASGSGDGLGEQDKEGSEYCEENPDAPACVEWAPEGEGGSFDLEGYDAEIAEAKQNLTDMVAEIKIDIETMFYFDGNSASLTCVEFIDLPFISKQFCLSDYSGQLSVISKAVLFMAFFVALIILLRR